MNSWPGDHQATSPSPTTSPSVLVDEVDPFADPDAPVGLSCRVYQTPDGMAGSPTLEQLRRALAAG